MKRICFAIACLAAAFAASAALPYGRTELLTVDLTRRNANIAWTWTDLADTSVRLSATYNGDDFPTAGWGGEMYIGDSSLGCVVGGVTNGYNELFFDVGRDSIPTNGKYVVQIVATNDAGRIEEWARGWLTVRASPAAQGMPTNWSYYASFAGIAASMASNVVTKAYVEGLGIGGTDTNAVCAIIDAQVGGTNSLVHKTGAETIAGVKTFTDNISMQSGLDVPWIYLYQRRFVTDAGDVYIPNATSGTLALTADATLTERGFTAWEVTPATFQGLPIEIRWVDATQYGYPGYSWEPFAGSRMLGGDYNDNENATTFYCESTIAEVGGPISATRTALQGYQLGSQTDKPLASEAEAEALRTAVAGKANDADVVHKSGDTMTGNLTMSNASIHAYASGFQSPVATIGGDGVMGYKLITQNVTLSSLAFTISADQTYTVRLPLGNGTLALTSDIDAAISPTAPAFSNAVLSVGLGIDTNTVANINALVESAEQLPADGAATAGALLVALAAAVAALRKLKADRYTTGTAAVSGGVLALSTETFPTLDATAMTASDTINVSLPTVSGTKVVNCLLRVDTGAAVPVLAFDSSLKFVNPDSSWATLEASSHNLFSFTWAGGNVWAVGRMTAAIS